MNTAQRDQLDCDVSLVVLEILAFYHLAVSSCVKKKNEPRL
jgi:hypothetical protein